MDASQTALDSLRTVEFRETLKGYHRDDVDEYLERAAVEAEGLQEQLRQSGERLRQAAERISQLEAELAQMPEPQPVEPAVPDDTLQRTLLLAQKFVDETKADSEAQALRIISEADAKARTMTEQAQARASQIASESEQRLRDEIGRLEDARSKLSNEVEAMSRHLEGERHRLRAALGEILKWVDENVQAAPGEAGPRGGDTMQRVAGGPPTGGAGPAGLASEGNRPSSGQSEDAHSSQIGGPGQAGDAARMQTPGAAARPTTTNAVLPL